MGSEFKNLRFRVHGFTVKENRYQGLGFWGTWSHGGLQEDLLTEAGSYLRLIDLCITQLKAQGPSRFCNKSKEEEEVFLNNPEVDNLRTLR